MKRIFALACLIISFNSVKSQGTELGIFYGKFYALYKFIDYGSGFRNLPGSQRSGYPAICVNKKFSKSISGEATASFLAYQQYTGTRLYSPGFFSVMYGGNISATVNYSVVNKNKFETRLKLGVGVGITPDLYQGEFVEIFVDESSGVDSISRGNIKRDFASIFPTLCTGLDFSYRISKRFRASLMAQYQKGFIKITEYDMYYNDGSGNNDQHAKQWGNGSFYGFQLGIRYSIRDGKKQKR